MYSRVRLTEIFRILALSKQELKLFIWILVISIFGLSSLFQANTLYIDDYIRAMSDLGWNFNGRPLATFLTTVLQLGRPFTDISPLPQIIAVAIYSLGVIYLARIFKFNNFLFLLLIGLITILNPYNLSMFPFVFDSFTMSISIFLTMLGLYTITYVREKYNKFEQLLWGSFVSVLYLLSALCIYQTSLSFYFIGFIFYLLVNLCTTNNYQKSIIDGLIFGSILMFSFVLYIPIKNSLKLSDYTIQSSALPPLSDLLPTIIKNILQSWSSSKYHFQNNLIFFLFLGLLLFVLITVFLNLFTQNYHKTLKSKTLFNFIFSFFLILFYIFIILTSFIFPSYILVNPPWSMRIFLGVVAIVSYSCFFLTKFVINLNNKFIKLFLVFYFSLIILSFVNLSLTYGNVITQQNLYEEKVGGAILNDIENLSNKYSISLTKPKISFVNSEKVNTLRNNLLVQKSFEKYPIIGIITYPHFTSDNFGITKLETFSISIERLPKENFYRENETFYNPQNPPILERQLYNIYLENNEVFIIVFNE